MPIDFFMIEYGLHTWHTREEYSQPLELLQGPWLYLGSFGGLGSKGIQSQGPCRMFSLNFPAGGTPREVQRSDAPRRQKHG